MREERMTYLSGSPPMFSIVVPCFNQLSYTRQCVESLIRSTCSRTTPYELILIDNGSYDGTAAYVEECVVRHRHIRSITLSRNSGFSYACNCGAENATGQYLVFLHNDSSVTSGWLSALIGPFTDKKTGIVGPKLVSPQTRKIYQAGYVCNAQLGSFYPIYRHFDSSFPGVNRIRAFQAVHSACLVIERELFAELGMFADYALEDIDLCLKAKAAGREVIYNPRSCVFHYGLVTLNGSVPGETPPLNVEGFLNNWRESWFVPDDEQYYYEDGFRVTIDENREVILREVVTESCMLTRRGMDSLDTGLVEEGEALLLEAVLTWPGNMDAWLGLTVLRLAQERTLEALYFCDQALRTQPESDQAKILKGKILLLYGSRNLAADVLRDVIEHNPAGSELRKEAQEMMRSLSRRVEVSAD